MKCSFQWIQPDKLQNVWQTIRPGLEIAAKKAPGGWIPEDVYMQIKTGDAVLHLAIADSRYRGFIVTKSLDTLEGRKLLIWILQGDNSGGIMANNMDQIDDWAQKIGAVKIQFQSPRKGWERTGDRLGFEPVQVVYEKVV